MNEPVVTWLPAHPLSGSVSMQRYWMELSVAAQKIGKEVACPFTLDKGLVVPRVSRFRRAWALYMAYPILVRRVNTPIIHLLDHSAAQLIPYLSSASKIVVTVHDLIPLIERAELTDAQLKRTRDKFALLRRADVLVAISNATKQQLIDLLGVHDDRIRVIHNGYSTFSDVSGAYGCTLPHTRERGHNAISILSVGSCLVRKNLTIFPAVLRALKARGMNPILYRVGPYLPDTLRREIVDVIGGDNLHEMGRVSDQILEDLYTKCDVLFFPSLFEGFGLPILEAMGKGCPVVCSNTTSLPEIGGDAALYFSPDNPEEAAGQLFAVLDGFRRKEMVDKGLKRVRQFSWEKCAAEFFMLYDELMEGGG